MVTEPAMFVGTVRHRRIAPVRHAFRYRTCLAWLDIDRLPGQMAASRLLGYNRRNVAAFYDADHLGASAGGLRPALAAAAERDGVALPDGPIMLLAHLRHFGYVFNPISLFYCFDRGAALRLVGAEVRNTFGGAHLYWLHPRAAGPTFRATAAKRLYVSPFLPVDMDYSFALTRPADRLAAHITVTRDGVPRFDATLCLERRPWRAPEIRRLIARYPVMTATVTAAIHWQALRLWWKGAPSVPRATRDGVGERAAVAGDGLGHPGAGRR
jgi:DUF1365 family protein